MMVAINSQRAKNLLASPKAFQASISNQMRRYPGEDFVLWASIEMENNNVKKLSFFGEMEDWQIVLLESWASIMIGKDLSHLDQLTLRECEAYLRDRNSEPALTAMTPQLEENFKKLFSWLRRSTAFDGGADYQFSSVSGPFRNLKLADKIRELKGFLSSAAVLDLYVGLSRPQLLDVEELTVYLDVPFQTDREKALLEELHMMGVAVFEEENLNFIPEST